MRRYAVFVLAIVAVAFFAVVAADAKGRKEAAKPTATPAATAPVTGAPAPATPAPAFRYIQTDTYIRSDFSVPEGTPNYMSLGGCCFMSCLGVAQSAAGLNLTSKQINEIRTAATPGDLSPDMQVKSFAAIINRALAKLGTSLSAQVVKDTSSYETVVCNATLVQGQVDETTYHWVEGNSVGEKVYDPAPKVVVIKVTRYVYIRISGYIQ